jgi:hypothetical protein
MIRACVSTRDPWPTKAVREGFVQYCWVKACEHEDFACELNDEFKNMVRRRVSNWLSIINGSMTDLRAR